jgi:hypothetical protein
MKIRQRFVCFWLFAALALIGCGGDDGPVAGGGGTPGSVQGQFLDSAVEGLTYITEGDTAETDVQGNFTYRRGSNVQFSVGGIVIGTGLAASKMTPVDLVVGATSEMDDTVTNIARFMQTIDDDGGPGNGIKITPAIRSSAAGHQIDFGQSASVFGTDPNVQSVVSDLTSQSQAGTRSLVSIQAAQAHLRNTLVATYNGTYRGTYSVDADPKPVVGTWEITASSGIVAGSFTKTPGTTASSFTVVGSMIIPGILDVTGPSGAFIYGTIESGGLVAGRWYGPAGGPDDSGEFTGKRN